ncbi:hypothetical protein INT45_006848 [Circinella minor]|uniref:MULE transposase domain-containing protein n=1 Tax=Circinella minor TaxID=1195481 RepID=A0A8H7RNR5_9FUNG|nr:hypothetical protein INT45_006848 [Circinella minor]
MYSIVIRNPTFDRGVPIAYLITNYQSAESLKQWFIILKAIGVNPVKITIDCDLSEANAIVAIYSESTVIQYCSWHVARAWMVARSLFLDMRDLMWEEEEDQFGLRLQEFKEKWATQSVFLAYFTQQWLDNDRYKRWVRAFQPDMYRYMETNSYIGNILC